MRKVRISLYCKQGQLHRCMNEQEESDITDSVQYDESASASGNQKYKTSNKKAANTMMDKTQRLLQLRDVYNENQPLKKKKWSDIPTADFLTRYCQEMAEEQWDLRLEYDVVHAKTDEWWVYFPHTRSVEKLEFLSKTLDGNPLVLQTKNLHQLMQEKTLAIRGMPLPCSDDAPEALETAHKTEIHLPDQIRELQMSQQNAATLMVAHKDTFKKTASVIPV
ncbi:hypothetical protein IV203_034578 [Nitzschia inconspicua]|uniref:Uncharacterized protein n=1 Tax=Nitzschia inconspicua TaxID=303405 RepID=A0A9K3P8X3_9STRA|nr:hypothetical protein IV203_002637 [Nitzschia inconspicua]KAG7359480.1 hypothetical protein IV203_034578 [Nitzschia inconspicua]